MRPEVSIVIPVYNEEDNLPILAQEIHAAFETLGKNYEILWVDDGSTDGSLATLGRLAASDPHTRVLHLRANSGQSAALAAGFRNVRGNIVVTLDADLQNDPADIGLLLAELPGWDLVSGVRTRRQDDWVRRISSRIANGVRNWATAEQVTDVGCSLKAYRAEILGRLPLFRGMHRFLPTLVRLAGGRIKEVPVNHRPRLHGKTKYSIGNRLFRSLADLMAVRWMQRRWIDRQLVEEITDWTPSTFGSSSASSARLSSSDVSSSSGSLPKGSGRA
ncbi:MAG TPA: glycosyltransferase family 2 protein [Thermoanaerobaculia bacterium]|nr:glycosyltransferase family 2 protein [Thermoanaerobaculia bacterium]